MSYTFVNNIAGSKYKVKIMPSAPVLCQKLYHHIISRIFLTIGVHTNSLCCLTISSATAAGYLRKRNRSYIVQQNIDRSYIMSIFRTDT